MCVGRDREWLPRLIDDQRQPHGFDGEALDIK